MKVKDQTTTSSLSSSQSLPMSVGQPCPFRSAYSPRLRVSISFAPEGRTKQSFAAECDINNIMKRYQSSGLMPPNFGERVGQFLDCPEFSFQDALNMVRGAQELFDALPSAVRERFANDPARMLDFVGREENYDEARKLGLLDDQKVAARAAQAAQATPPAASAAQAPVGDSGASGGQSAPGGAKS